ncbi:MAG: hypothetical protein RR313_00095 [Anaerovoracaceae bacterium]
MSMPTANNQTIELTTGFWKRLDRKLQDKPLPMQVMQRRSMNTATTILIGLQDVPFDKLSCSLYFYCKDIKMNQFTHYYESQLELAGANPERFAFGLHKFYNDVSHKIKKENLYEEFFEFLSLCTKSRFTARGKNVDVVVLNLYMDLLLQNLEYLRPNKFDFTSIVVGLKTTGEIITATDIYPTLDMPGYEIERLVREHKDFPAEQLFSTIEKIYKKYGYDDVKTIEDMEQLANIDRIFTNEHVAMTPFINEYTFDLLPVQPFTTYALDFHTLCTDLDYKTFQMQLHKRKRTLPTNGMTFQFTEGGLIKSVLFKEILYNNSITLLYKMTTTQGDLCGYYDTKTDFFYNIFLDYDYPQVLVNLQTLILYLYATAVLADKNFILSDLPKHFCYTFSTLSSKVYLSAEAFGAGGRLKNVYDPDKLPATDGPTRIGNDKYTQETKAIQGFIRRVGVDQQPSEKARELAESLGYDLAPNETYVQPFIKKVFRLKELI